MGKWARMGFAATVMLTGCKGFWNALPTTTTTTSGAASGVFYVLDQKTTQLAGYSFATGSTTPTAVSGSPYALGAVPLAMTINPTANFLYVSTAAGIYLYTIGTGGVLTLGNSGQVISQDPAYSMQVDPTDSWLVEAVSGEGTLNAIPIDSTTGLYNSTLTEQTVTLPASTVQQLVLSPANSTSPYAFVAMGGGGTAVIPFTAANSNPFGSVATIAVKNTAGGANTIGVDTTNRLLYVGETVALTASGVTQTGGLRVFTIGATAITELAGSPYATGGTGPSAILSTADYVYVANKAVSGSTTGNISGFSINTTGSTYSLTLVNTVTAGDSPVGLAEDSTSTYLLAVNSGGNPDLNTYTFDTTTPGKLDASVTAATGTDPVEAAAVAAVP